MKILINTNVALDILLQRPDYTNAALIFSFTQRNVIESYNSASAITDIFYISQKDIGKKAAKESLKKLLQIFKPATVSSYHIYQALDLDWDDFEDSVQYVVGESFPVDYIITRNLNDYTSSSIPVVTPEQFIKVIAINS
ncbi:MAG: PIN domain-containing protein [Treponema sp.]|nr:PIN domain-containing protein [Treponema sp.]